ncbi:prefoldin subunit hypothetical protein [Limosa lapponica baueri]|uniref:Prefoldin subunit 1 n=1 Tax=Limosa lapponica baueri TaxID=1758121 RepID=A0A2I0U319_LIMLA|nr:prefoldin subunit hypothetical protein [Limosa lapponica baueri]
MSELTYLEEDLVCCLSSAEYQCLKAIPVQRTNSQILEPLWFILQSKGVIHNQLLEKQRIAEEKIKELEQKKSYLERSVKEAEDNIREMLMARRAQ